MTDTAHQPLMELSTTVEEAKVFTVDGEEYKLLSLNHLSPEDEAGAMGDTARFENLMMRLARASNDADARRIARQVRIKRLDVLCKLTTMPREVAEKLPMPAQAKIFQAVQRESLGEDGGDSTDV